MIKLTHKLGKDWCIIPPAIAKSKILSLKKKICFGYLVGTMNEDRVTMINNRQLEVLTGLDNKSLRSLLSNFKRWNYIDKEYAPELGSARFITIKEWILQD